MGLELLEDQLTRAVERLSPSVVRITRRVNLRRRAVEHVPAEGTGSGVIVDADGFVITNDHVVRGSRSVQVTLGDGRALEGEVLGEDSATDLAVVRVPVRGLPAAELADSDRLKVGQLALAIGNSLGLPGGPTVSAGVVSALARPMPGADFIFEGLLQTDAAINPGNSGGPLADIHGRVIGVNAAVVAFAQGVGFAVPSNTVRRVMAQIRERGRVVRPWLGISGIPIDQGIARAYGLARDTGILVAELVRGSPADRAGLAPGDILTRVGTLPMRTMRDLVSGLATLPIGGAVDVSFARRGVDRKGVIRVMEAPPQLAS